MDLTYEIMLRKEAFERAHDVSPNVIVIGADLIPELFPLYKPTDKCYMYGMLVIASSEDPKLINVGYIAKGSIYRHESCPKKNKCIDYQGYHCEGCNGVEEY